MSLKDKYNLVEENRYVFYLKQSKFDIVSLGVDLANYCRENNLLKGRICFHENIEDPLQRMIIYHSKLYKIPIHYHKFKEETLILLTGACSYKEYSREAINNKNVLKLEKEIDIKPMEAINIKQNTLHNLDIKGDIVFLEFSIGPFSKESTTFADNLVTS